MKITPGLLILTALLPCVAGRIASAVSVPVDANRELNRLIQQADTDRDQKITVLDRNSTFWLEDTKGRSLEVGGTYYLSNLLQELKLATELKSPALDSEKIFENPVKRISRSIREIYWDGLTRRIDSAHLSQVLPDNKIPASSLRHLYVSDQDEPAYEYFSKASLEHPELNLRVWRLPTELDAQAYSQLTSRHGVLALGLRKDATGAVTGTPFVVPGGRFNEMYGWDSYFEALGLLQDGRLDLAQAMVDNFVYEIENYGKILNANRTYYLNRSQPPFLTSMISSVYEKMEKTPTSKAWLEKSMRAAIREYLSVWMNADRLTSTGLSRYFGNGRGIPPEVEPGHFDFVLKPAAAKYKLSIAELVRRYNAGLVKDAALDEFFSQDRSVRESGHDTTYRWRVNGRDRAADFVTVDLNSLLYKAELDLARLIKSEFADQFTYKPTPNALPQTTTSADWLKRAASRKELMRKFLWDPERKIFFDFDFKSQRRSSYVSATAFYPLWAKDASNQLLTQEEANASIAALLRELEAPGGIASTAKSSLEKFGDPKAPRQWEYPNGWAPHQMIAWKALQNYGENAQADRLIYKWLYSIARNASNFNGTVPEKMDVVKRSHAVFAEYGNVGTQFSYITKEGFGWMNASFQVGLQSLTPKWRPDLEALKPPEWTEVGK